MIRKSLTALFVLIGSHTYCQDSLVLYKELQFVSDDETKAFYAFFKQGQENYFNLFYLLDESKSKPDNDKAKTRFDELIADLNTPKTLKKNPSKKVKLIYEAIHEALFDQYREENRFAEIFDTGRYNCVSATALYSLAFEELDIPYTIKEKPTHVYVVSYPDTDQILVESTDPQGGYIRFTENNKKALVQRLADAKMISSNEMQFLTTDQLFDKYYLADQSITIKELVGIQFMNQAIYKLNQEAIQEAFTFAQKGWMFYPSQNSSNLLLAICLQYLMQTDYSEPHVVHFLAMLSRFEEIENDLVTSEYARMLNAVLIENGNSKKIDTYTTQLLEAITDNDVKKDIRYVYNYERGRILYNQSRSEDALSFLEKAYSIKSSNLDITNLFIGTMAKASMSSTNDEFIELLEFYKERHASLSEQSLFRSMLANAYLIKFGMAFDLRDEKTGLRYKKLFETYYSDELTIDHNNLGRAYSITAVYYFRRGYTTKARQILNEGLQKSPNNHELLIRKNMIK